MGVMRRLARLRGDDELRVGLVGAGMVGHNMTYQINFTPGMRTALIVNRTAANAVDALRRAGVPVDDSTPAAYCATRAALPTPDTCTRP